MNMNIIHNLIIFLTKKSKYGIVFWKIFVFREVFKHFADRTSSVSFRPSYPSFTQFIF